MTESAAEIGWECQQLVLKAARAVDDNHPEGLRDAFASDAVQHVRGQEQQGVETMIAAVKVPLAERILCHTLSPSLIEVDADGQGAQGTTCVTVYRGARKGAAYPLPLEGPAGVAVYHDRFRKTGDGWRIVSRDVKMVFGG